jgi:hypothetical protein
MHRGKDGLAVSLPGLELAIDEVGALVDGIELAILGRDIALPRKELLQVVGRDNVATLSGGTVLKPTVFAIRGRIHLERFQRTVEPNVSRG